MRDDGEGGEEICTYMEAYTIRHLLHSAQTLVIQHHYPK